MEIPAATLAQVTAAADGTMALVEDDVCNVARDLRQLHPDLRLRFSESAGHFAVYQQIEKQGRVQQHLVTTSQVCDQRLVKRVRMLLSPEYSFGDEVARVQAQRQRERKRAFVEKLGDPGERAFHALRKDLGIKDRAFIKVPLMKERKL
jgi:hypothetical protein